ncbi:MAG: MgtC/SapB family protein [Thermodesulfovibrionia bacterium]|nr:MgtC/SapB family protein [Thermodesulfovibrionia bacterium]
MISTYEIALRLLLGAFVGGIIGFEREMHGRAAGFRTQLIVCVAAVLIMIVSENYFFHLKDLDPNLRIDPARIAAGALMGIGFLGSGVIIKDGFAIRGLTTAASIWIVSAIGLAIGAGLYVEGLMTTAITILALVVLRAVERKINTVMFRTITVSTGGVEIHDAEEKICSVLKGCGFHVHSVDYEKQGATREYIFTFHILTKRKEDTKKIFQQLNSLEFVNTIRIRG